MKLTWQVTTVVVVGVLGLVVLVIGLAVFAKMSDGAIVGLIGGIGAVIVNLILVARGQQKTAETLEQQDVKLDRVVEQTNGMSEAQLEEIADRAAGAAALQVVQAWREGGLR